jgi:hypothetical protein
MKTKGIKRTPQEWIEIAQKQGGFRPTPPPKPFIVQRRDGTPQQMEFVIFGRTRMRVKMLREMLKDYDDDAVVCVRPQEVGGIVYATVVFGPADDAGS